MRSQGSAFTPYGVVGGDGACDGPFGLPLLDQVPTALRVDWGDPDKTHDFWVNTVTETKSEPIVLLWKLSQKEKNYLEILFGDRDIFVYLYSGASQVTSQAADKVVLVALWLGWANNGLNRRAKFVRELSGKA